MSNFGPLINDIPYHSYSSKNHIAIEGCANILTTQYLYMAKYVRTRCSPILGSTNRTFIGYSLGGDSSFTNYKTDITSRAFAPQFPTSNPVFASNKIVYYYHLLKVKDYLSLPVFNNCFFLKPSNNLKSLYTSLENVPTDGASYTKDDILSDMGERFLITSFAVAKDDMLPRLSLNQGNNLVEPLIKMEMPTVNFYKDNKEFNYSEKGDGFFYMDVIRSYCSGLVDGDKFNPSDRIQNETNISYAYGPSAIPLIIQKETGFGKCFMARIKPNTSTSYAKNSVFVTFEKKEIVDLLNKIGVPFTFNSDEFFNKPVSEFTDFREPGQPSNQTGGGGGEGDNFNDIPENVIPGITPFSAFNSAYAVSLTEVKDLKSWLWTSTFIDDLKLLFNDPAEALVGLTFFPFDLSKHKGLGAPQVIHIGNVESTTNGNPIGTNYNCIFDMGTMHVAEYYGTAMDYEPYTKVQIFLPYIGVRSLDTASVMDKDLNVKYVVDISSGMCDAEVFADGLLLYTFKGQIGTTVPISSTNFSDVVEGLIKSVGSVVSSTIAGGIVAGPAGSVVGAGLSMAKAVSANKVRVEGGGLADANTGLYMPQRCFLIYERPIQSIANNFAEVNGFPCNYSTTLTNVKGYTQCADVILNTSATEEEARMIKELLESGIYIS